MLVSHFLGRTRTFDSIGSVWGQSNSARPWFVRLEVQHCVVMIATTSIYEAGRYWYAGSRGNGSFSTAHCGGSDCPRPLPSSSVICPCHIPLLLQIGTCRCRHANSHSQTRVHIYASQTRIHKYVCQHNQARVCRQGEQDRTVSGIQAEVRFFQFPMLAYPARSHFSACECCLSLLFLLYLAITPPPLLTPLSNFIHSF